jgi:glycosyltransferase involved in cell wall biosynthesis
MALKILWLGSMLPRPFAKFSTPWNIERIKGMEKWSGAEVMTVCPIRLTPPEVLIFQFPPKPKEIRQWIKLRKDVPLKANYHGVDITYLQWHGLPKKFFWGVEGRFMYLQLRKFLAKIVNDFRPDVIHSPWLNPEGVAGCLLGQEFSIPCVVQAQGSDVNYYLKHYPMRKAFIKDIQKSAALLYVCHSLKNNAENLGLKHPNQGVVYNGVDIDAFTIPIDNNKNPDKKTIVTVADLYPVKNHKLLINAFSRYLTLAKDNTELTLIGDGSCRQDLEEQTRLLKIQDRVNFVGSVPHARVTPYLQNADLFCLSSFSEGLPFTVLEAMACGLPTVATNVGGVSEAVVDGKTGFLTESDNVDAFANAIMLAFSQQWNPLSIRDVILSNFTWQQYSENMMEIYRSIC